MLTANFPTMCVKTIRVTRLTPLFIYNCVHLVHISLYSFLFWSSDSVVVFVLDLERLLDLFIH